jgi:hypothetical protein
MVMDDELLTLQPEKMYPEVGVAEIEIREPASYNMVPEGSVEPPPDGLTLKET